MSKFSGKEGEIPSYYLINSPFVRLESRYLDAKTMKVSSNPNQGDKCWFLVGYQNKVGTSLIREIYIGPSRYISRRTIVNSFKAAYKQIDPKGNYLFDYVRNGDELSKLTKGDPDARDLLSNKVVDNNYYPLMPLYELDDKIVVFIGIELMIEKKDLDEGNF